MTCPILADVTSKSRCPDTFECLGEEDDTYPYVEGEAAVACVGGHGGELVDRGGTGLTGHFPLFICSLLLVRTLHFSAMHG